MRSAIGFASRLLGAAAALGALIDAGAPPAEARITKIEIAKSQPAFGGQSFGTTGAYERLSGRAYGEVDPALPGNAIIQDLHLAPRNARGLVEYATDIEILRPADFARGNRVLLFEVLNRGNKLSPGAFNIGIAPVTADRNALTTPGDGHLMGEGYTIVWYGWQADVLPGVNRLTLSVPAAKNPDGSPVTGIVRTELTTPAPTRTLNLSSGWFTGLNHSSYPTASSDNRAPSVDGFVPTLTVRAHEQEPRAAIPNSEWSFGACADGGAATPSETQICYPAGFLPGRLYELTYRAKDPLVMGLGFAATRDLASFLRSEPRDSQGTANPVFRDNQVAVIFGSSQSGRMIRSLIQLGFNQDEGGRRVFAGAYPHIGGGLMPLNIRFAQPGRAWGDQVDHLFPAYDFPFTYARQTDPLSQRTQGLLDRCNATDTCPRIFHVATALEMWEGRQSLGLTDPLGQRDVADPDNVRTFIMVSTQHGAAPLPLATQQPFGNCQQQPNPNPQIFTMRALLGAFTAWVRDDKLPPNSAVPRIAEGTLTPPDQVRFPPIPANEYGGVSRPAMRFLRVHNPLHVLDYGPFYNAADSSGVLREPPKVQSAAYGLLMPQVDADGNDLGGLRSLQLQVPIGTYTGWNLGRADRFENGFCSLQGSFVPFARTRAERMTSGDPRPSLEERYPTAEAYAAAVRRAADELVSQRFLLPADAAILMADAALNGIRQGP
ncbi:MAG: hypothetical protein HY244_02810 [Rhizobiales bacterium]|nr:hypothetical protein [Hyphomicrobiales bacterium]